MARSSIRKKSLAPEILERFNQIASQLGKTAAILEVFGMLDVLCFEHCTNYDQYFNELKSMVSSSGSPDSKVEEFRSKVVQLAEKGITKLTRVQSMNQMTVFVHLSTGVCLFKAEFGLQNFTVAAQYFNSAVRMGWTPGYYYLGCCTKMDFVWKDVTLL